MNTSKDAEVFLVAYKKHGTVQKTAKALSWSPTRARIAMAWCRLQPTGQGSRNKTAAGRDLVAKGIRNPYEVAAKAGVSLNRAYQLIKEGR